MVSDPVADLLTRVRNAYRAGKKEVAMPSSKLKEAIVKILKRDRFIKHFEVKRTGNKSFLKLYLHYSPSKEPAVVGLQRVSKPGQRIYVRKGDIPTVAGGLGIAILSTSAGVLSDREVREAGVGGELLCLVW